MSFWFVFTGFHYTFGHVIEEQGSTGSTEMDEETAARFAGSFPTIARVLSMSAEAGTSRDDVYRAGLARILGRDRRDRARAGPGNDSRRRS